MILGLDEEFSDKFKKWFRSNVGAFGLLASIVGGWLCRVAMSERASLRSVDTRAQAARKFNRADEKESKVANAGRNLIRGT